MPKILQREIDAIKREFLALGTLVEESLQRAIKAFESRDRGLAEEVIETDNTVDAREVDLEEDCLKILALHQPVAGDLRFIIAILKINNDLERIGDLAVNISKRVKQLPERSHAAVGFNFKEISQKTTQMLRKSLDALVNNDTQMAKAVCGADDEVDDLNRRSYLHLTEEIKKNPQDTEILLNYLSISRILERIADYATNIAEDVIYLVDGNIMRHRKRELKVAASAKSGNK